MKCKPLSVASMIGFCCWEQKDKSSSERWLQSKMIINKWKPRLLHVAVSIKVSPGFNVFLKKMDIFLEKTPESIASLITLKEKARFRVLMSSLAITLHTPALMVIRKPSQKMFSREVFQDWRQGNREKGKMLSRSSMLQLEVILKISSQLQEETACIQSTTWSSKLVCLQFALVAQIFQ